MAKGEFSVCQFFGDGTHEYVCRFVDAETAVKTAVSYTSKNRPSVMLGITKKVIITDGGDFTNWEWQNGKGVVFPKPKED